MLLDNAEFLKQLKALFESTTQSGSVFLTQKRLSYEETPSGTSDPDTELPAEASTSATPTEKQYPCIIKATDGKNASSKTKISTIVQPSDYLSFSTAYGQLLKSSFNTMRKKDKKKKKELKGAGPFDAKKRALAATGSNIPKVFGSRRGAGHSKRQRLEKARKRAVARVLERRRRRPQKNTTGISSVVIDKL